MQFSSSILFSNVYLFLILPKAMRPSPKRKYSKRIGSKTMFLLINIRGDMMSDFLTMIPYQYFYSKLSIIRLWRVWKMNDLIAIMRVVPYYVQSFTFYKPQIFVFLHLGSMWKRIANIFSTLILYFSIAFIIFHICGLAWTYLAT
jgi:hypothetical protein